MFFPMSMIVRVILMRMFLLRMILMRLVKMIRWSDFISSE